MSEPTTATTTRPRPVTEDAIAEALAAPFPPDAVEWRVGKVAKAKEGEGRPKRAMALAYIDARAVTRRLNTVLGIGGWKSRHYPCGDYQIACEISIRINGEWVSKTDGAWIGNVQTTGKVDPKDEQRMDMEGKGAFSTALKRAAVVWGIGEYLHHLPAPWDDIDQFSNFTPEAKERLAAIAAKPFEAWKKKRGQAAKIAAAAAAPAQAPVADPPAAAPAVDAAPAPSAPVDRQVLLRTWVDRIKEAPNLDSFSKLADSLKLSPPFENNTPEMASLRKAFGDRGKELGYKPPKGTSAPAATAKPPAQPGVQH